MNKMTINFNGQDYIAVYNNQSGYYEVNLQAPVNGGIYQVDITYADLFGQSYEDTQVVQVWAKEKIKIETNKVFMWIFDYKDFRVKDIVEISDYEINIDEETNANTIIKVLKKTTAKAKDIIVVKKNNEVVYWGVIDNIQNEDGKKMYEFTVKYITNIFNRTIELKTKSRIKNNFNTEDGLYLIRYNAETSKVADVQDISTSDNAGVFIGAFNGGANQLFGISKQSNGYYKIMAAHSHKYLTVNVEQDGDIVQYQDLNNDSQLFEIVRVETNQYCLISKLNGKYIRKRSSGYLRADTSQAQVCGLV